METSRTRSIRNNHKQDYRSAAADCFFFVYFGTCSFGKYCKFNHPATRDPLVDEEATSETYARIPCKFFPAGVCKYGTTCLYDHRLLVPQLNPKLHFNVLGLPKRWGESACSFYMRTGTCGYGIACRYHHPEPIFHYPDQVYRAYVGGEIVGYQNGYTLVNNWQNRKPVTITIKEPCVTLNDVGLPLRPEKRVCKYYENIGHCKYGKGCKFNHPMKESING